MEPIAFSPVHLGEAEIAEVIDTLKSVWITTGPKTARFEQEFAERVGAPSALAVNSATAAMHLGLVGFGIGPGDLVITTPMTFCSTAHVIEHCGATPLFVDIDEDTLNISPDAIEAAIASLGSRAEHLRALLPVHYGGHPVDRRVDEIALRHGLCVVEDAAHAIGASVGDVPIGNIDGPVNKAVAFSFYATKNLTTAEGGMLTGVPELIDECRIWSLHGMSRDSWKRYTEHGRWYYEVDRIGFKYNLTDVASAIGLHQLAQLDSFQARRREIADRYNTAFGDSPAIRCPVERAGYQSAWHLYPIRVTAAARLNRNQFIDAMSQAQIGTSVHFIPLHLQPVYRDTYALTPSDFPVASAAFEQLVSLPLHPFLRDDEVDRIIDTTRSLLDAD